MSDGLWQKHSPSLKRLGNSFSEKFQSLSNKFQQKVNTKLNKWFNKSQAKAEKQHMKREKRENKKEKKREKEENRREKKKEKEEKKKEKKREKENKKQERNSAKRETVKTKRREFNDIGNNHNIQKKRQLCQHGQVTFDLLMHIVHTCSNRSIGDIDFMYANWGPFHRHIFKPNLL